MGYHSTFVSTHTPLRLPQWFVERYGSDIHYGPGGPGTLPISSAVEGKFYGEERRYGKYATLVEDLDKALREVGEDDVHLLILHEDGSVARVHFGEGAPRVEGAEWFEAENVLPDHAL